MEPASRANAAVALTDEVARLTGRLKSVFAGVTQASGLSGIEATVLAAVTDARTPPTVPQIGRSLGHPRQVIGRACTALIAAGLVEARINPDHKRAPLLVATAQGRRLKHQADGRALQAAAALLQAVGFERCERLAGDLRSLRADIEAHLRERPAGGGLHGGEEPAEGPPAAEEMAR